MVEDPAKVYQEKLELFAYQQSWTNLLTRWKDASREYKENMIMMLLMHNYPFGAGTFIPKMGSVNPRTGKNYLPWGRKWVEGINHTFGTLLTEDDFRANFRAYQDSDPYRGIEKDKNFIKMMKTNGHRGSRARRYEGVITIVKSFADMYKMLTNPMNAEIYGKSFTPRSISGKRGRPPVRDGRYIEFNMRDMPVIMVRGRFPFSDKDKNMNDCYALVGMERPESKTDKTAISKWLTLLKGVFSDNMRMNDYDMIYQEISPCSLEYWMADIERRKFADTDLLGMPTTRKRMFKPTSRLQLRENGMFRFYTEETMDDEQGWNPDPMLDRELVDSMPDEYHVNSRKLNITENMSRFDEKWQRKMDALYEKEDNFSGYELNEDWTEAEFAKGVLDIRRAFSPILKRLGYSDSEIDSIIANASHYSHGMGYDIIQAMADKMGGEKSGAQKLFIKCRDKFLNKDAYRFLGNCADYKLEDYGKNTQADQYDLNSLPNESYRPRFHSNIHEAENDFSKTPRELEEIGEQLEKFGWTEYKNEYTFDMRKWIKHPKFRFLYEFSPSGDGFSFRLLAYDLHNNREYEVKDGQLVIDRSNPERPIPVKTFLVTGYQEWSQDPNIVKKLCNPDWLLGHFGFRYKNGDVEKIPVKNGQLAIFEEASEYESAYSKRRGRALFEGKALTPEEKMERWHNGSRKENIKACALEKLKEYRKICRAKGYTEELKQINAEINRRKKEGINESYLYEGVLGSYTEFSEPSKDRINDTITMLKKCRSNLDSVMYNFDRDLPDDVYAEMRQVYGHICSAMDLLPDYF